jgi:hypothetical protein
VTDDAYGREVYVPGEMSHNIGPPWTPDVWQKGPDVLVKDAQLDLFQARAGVEMDALDGGNSTPAMSGQPQDANEAEQLITPAPSGRAAQWRDTVNQLHKTEPLAGTIKPLGYGGGTGAPNPNA